MRCLGTDFALRLCRDLQLVCLVMLVLTPGSASAQRSITASPERMLGSAFLASVKPVRTGVPLERVGLLVCIGYQGIKLNHGNRLNVWDLERASNQPFIVTLDKLEQIAALAGVAKGRQLAVTDGKTLQVVSVPSAESDTPTKNGEPGSGRPRFELKWQVVWSVELPKPLRGARISVSSCGQYLAVWSSARGGKPPVLIYDVQEERLMRRIDAAGSSLRACSLIGESSSLSCAIAMQSGAVLMWNVQSGNQEKGGVLFDGGTYAAALSSKAAVACCLVPAKDERIEAVYVDLITGDRTTLLKDAVAVAPAFSPDGSTLTLGTKQGLEIWDTQSRRHLWTGTSLYGCHIRFGEMGRIAAAFEFRGENRVRLIDLEKRREIHPNEGHGGRVRCLTWSGSGRRLVSGADDVRIWNTATWGLQSVIDSHGVSQRVTSLEMARDSTRLAVGSLEYRPWQVGMKSTLKLLELGPEPRQLAAWDGEYVIDGVALSQDGTILVHPRCSVANSFGAYDGIVFRGDKSLEITREIPLTDEANAIHELAGDGRWVAIERGPSTVRLGQIYERGFEIWDIRKQTVIGRLASPSQSVTCISVSSKLRMLTAGDTKGRLFVWDVNHPKPLRINDTESEWVVQVDISARRHLVASVGEAGTVLLWDLNKVEPVLRFTPEGHACAVKFSPDGSRLACGHSNGTISIWKVHGK